MVVSVKRLLFLLALALPLLLTDLFIKAQVDQYLYWTTSFIDQYPYGGIGIFHNFLGIDFSINYVTNKGAAWGSFATYQNYLQLIRISLILALIGYTLFFNRDRSRQIPFVLIVTGAIGNVVDFFLYGHVVDMFHFCLWGYHFPTFNVADATICIGVMWLCLLSFWQKKPLDPQPAT